MSIATAIFRKRSARAYASVRERLGLVTATLAEDIAGMRIVQAFTREQANAAQLPRGDASTTARRTWRRSSSTALYFPFVDLLSTVALAVVLGYGGHLYFQRRGHARNAVRLHALRAELLRPGAAALAALRHVPLGHGRTGQDHGRARPGARGAPTCPAPRELPQSTARRLRGRALRLRRRARGAARARPRGPGWDDRRARRPHRRRASRRSPSCSHASTTRARADHDRRRTTCAK